MKEKLKKGLLLAAKLLVWVLVLGAAILPAVFMNSVYGYLPGLLVVLLLVLSLGEMLWLRRSIAVETAYTDIECERGKSVDIGIKLKNRSRVFCPKANAYIYISDLFGAHDERRKVSFTLPGREELDLGFGMEMTHIGCYSVGLECVEVYDFFGVFSLRVPVSGRFSAIVTPRIRPMNEKHDSENLLTEASTDTKTTVVGGTDYTGVRTYALGDPIKQIHWKLSAHSREYMTKIQESSRQQEFSVILDFAALGGSNTEQLMDLNDCLIETALSLVTGLSDEDASCALFYCDRTQSMVRTVPIGREDDVELIRSFALITPEPDASFPDACRILQQEGQGQNRGSNVVVVTSRVTPELLQELQITKGHRRSPELYMVVPAEWNSRELEKACAPLRQLDDAEIPYYVISASENFRTHTLS